MTIGATLRQAREKAGLSQAELAAQSGVPLKTIQGIEQDRWDGERFRLVTADQLARALKLPLDEFAKCVRPEKRKGAGK